MINEERVIISKEINIGATIAYNDKTKKRPLVLLIMGTGKTDRDGNAIGFKTNIYKSLSDMFVDFGYVCVRYDKRGTHESTGNYNTDGLNKLVDDAASVIEYAKELEYVDENNVIVCGHSEGAMIATLLTKKIKLERIILLGGACVSLKTALLYQNSAVLREFKDKKGPLAWYIKKVLTQEKIDKQVNSIFNKAKEAKKDRFFFNGAFMNTAWAREHGELTDDMFYTMLKEYNNPILAITGTADLSVDYKILDKIKDLEHVTTYIPENVNHIFREVDDNNNYMKIAKQYKRLSKNPMHKGTQDKIKEWLDRYTR